MVEVDLGELRRRLAAIGVTDVAALTGGASSLSFLGAQSGRPVVIKLAPPGVEPIGHRDVLRQARILKALAATRVPVPEVLWEEPGDPPLFVMSHVEGECVEPLFDGCAPGPDLAERYRNACRVMAALHSVVPGDLGLADESVVGPVAEVERWCQTLQTVDEALAPRWREVREALLHCAPTDFVSTVVHGDFRLGNLLARGTGISAVIDWEIWSIGDPRIDVGWFLVNCDPETYQRVPDAAGMAPPLTELVEIYQHVLGREVTDLAWFTALACFKSAATWSLIVKHNRRRRLPRDEWEAMAATIPRLLSRAQAMAS